MAPQPLSRVLKNCSFSPWSVNALVKHPDLAAIIADVISLGARAEHQWAEILVHLLRADPKTGMAMYAEVSSAEAQRAMLLAAAKARLSKKDYLLVSAVMAACAPARRIRNHFAHRLWGHADQISDGLLLIDPEELAGWNVELAIINQKMMETGEPFMPPEVGTRSIMVWKARDLAEARRAAFSVLEMLSILASGLDLSVSGYDLDGPTRHLLLKRPDVLREAQRLYRQNGLRAPSAPRARKPRKKP